MAAPGAPHADAGAPACEAGSRRLPPTVDVPNGQVMVPNPALRIDHALGMVVIEFRNSTADLSWSIPSERELAAYRAAAQADPAPNARAAPPAPSPSADVTLTPSETSRPDARSACRDQAAAAPSASAQEQRLG
jgi:hypothetical protein